MIPLIIAALAAWLLMLSLHRWIFFLPGRFVLFLAIFAAVRWSMRCLWQFGAGRWPPGLRPVPGRPLAAKVIRGRGR
jgi:hypothetical protein